MLTVTMNKVTYWQSVAMPAEPTPELTSVTVVTDVCIQFQ